MRIGIYDPYLDTPSGGEKYILNLALCLAKQHEVYIFWPPSKASEVKEKIYTKFGYDLSSLIFTHNIFSKKTPLILRLLKSLKYDYIVFLSDGSIPLICSRLILHFQFPVEWVIANGIKTQIKFLRVKETICNSFFTKLYIDKKFGITSKVLYPFIDMRMLEEKKKESVILNVGRFGIHEAGSSYKKQDFLIEIFQRLVDKGLKNWRFILVVSILEKDKELLKAIKKKIYGYPMDIIENPDKSKLWQIYAKSKIYWHAAGYGEDLVMYPDRAEHFGISTVEAMLNGVVPIVINAGGQSEIVEDLKSGYLWNTANELIDYTKAVMTNPKLWQNLSNEAKKRARYFSEERFCQGLIGIIK